MRPVLCAAVVAGLALTGAGGARAVLLVYEPFDYAPGTVLDDTPASGLGLTGTYTALGTLPQQHLTATSPGLGYGSLQGAPGVSAGRISDTQGVTAAGASVSLEQPLSIAPGEAIYWSTLLTLDDGMNGNHLANITLVDDDTGDLLFFGEPGVGSGALRVAAQTQATGSLVADGTDDAFGDGDTVLLVGRYVNGAAPGGDLLELVSYDTASGIQLPPVFDPTDPNAEAAYALSGLDIDLVQITSITLTIRGLDNNFIDELRIGSSYADVIPEPATGSLVAAGLAGLGALRRTRRRAERPDAEGGRRGDCARRSGTRPRGTMGPCRRTGWKPSATACSPSSSRSRFWS